MPYEWDDTAQEWVWVPDAPPFPPFDPAKFTGSPVYVDPTMGVPQNDPSYGVQPTWYDTWKADQERNLNRPTDRTAQENAAYYGPQSWGQEEDTAWRNELAGNDPTLKHGAWKIPNYYNMNQDDEALRGKRIMDTYKQNDYLPWGLAHPGEPLPKQTAGGGVPGNGPGGPGGGGGGGGPAPVDPYAWMADFGGPAIIKAFLRTPGERIQDWYNRHGGDPLKTLIGKYQEIKGMAPTSMLKEMLVGALGWGGAIDPNTGEPITNMPTSPLLENLAKTGGNYNSYNKNSGLRMVGTRPWTEITKGFQNYSPVGAAIWPPATA